MATASVLSAILGMRKHIELSDKCGKINTDCIYQFSIQRKRGGKMERREFFEKSGCGIA
jgi:hypothetical protein